MSQPSLAELYYDYQLLQLQVRKQMLKEVMLFQGHKATERQGQNLNPGL